MEVISWATVERCNVMKYISRYRSVILIDAAENSSDQVVQKELAHLVTMMHVENLSLSKWKNSDMIVPKEENQSSIPVNPSPEKGTNKWKKQLQH